jgi:2-oxoglutarate dehydrogenase E2 component (dihydrolipoamide succinyltransferase)
VAVAPGHGRCARAGWPLPWAAGPGRRCRRGPAAPPLRDARPHATAAAAAAAAARRRVKMTRLRLRVSERLKGAQNTYAMLTTFNEVDMTGLMELRAKYKVGVMVGGGGGGVGCGRVRSA